MYFTDPNSQNNASDEYVVHSGSIGPTFKKGRVTVERPKSGIYEFDEEQPPAAVGFAAFTDDNVNMEGKKQIIQNNDIYYYNSSYRMFCYCWSCAVY